MAKQKKGTINKALAVLDCFTSGPAYLTISEIASLLEIPFATAHRTVSILIDGNFLYRDPDSKKIRLGPKLYYLGRLAFESNNLMQIAKPFIEDLRDETNETVNFYVREGICRICYEQAESHQNLKHSSPLGKKLPLWAGASGRCFLAFMEEKNSQLITEIVEQMEPLTMSTIISEDELKKSLEKIRSRGYAVSCSEREEGVASIAAPIFDDKNSIIACLAISGPSIRFDLPRKEIFIKALINTVTQISEKIGSSALLTDDGWHF